MNVDAYPLSWPAFRAMTPAHKRQRSNFRRDGNHAPTVHFVRIELREELRRLGVRHYTLSTNLALRQDGEPRSGQGEPDNPGAAVYFKLSGRDTVLACDRWDRVACNIRAIVKHIEALRGQDRWGVGTIEQAFAGYQALPSPETGSPKRTWRQVMGFDVDETVFPDGVRQRYRSLAKERSQTEADLLELNVARDEALEELRHG